MYSRYTLRGLTLGAGLVLGAGTASATGGDSLRLWIDHDAYLQVAHDDTVTFECSGLALLSVSHVVVENHCNDAPKINFSENVEVYDQPVDQTLSLMSCSFEAEDDCDRVGFLRVHVRLVDTTGPLLQGVPTDLTLAADAAVPPPPYVYAVDNCTIRPEVTLATAIDTVEGERTITRTWTAVDEVDNRTTGTQTITQELRGNTPSGITDCASSPQFTEDRIALSGFGCEDGTEMCLPVVAGFGGSLTVDDERVEDYSACGTVSMTAYRISELFPEGVEGPFEMIWRVGAGAYRARIAGRDSLLPFVRGFVRGWAVDLEGDVVYGPAEDRFHDLSSVSASNRKTYVAQPSLTEVGAGAKVLLATGLHQVIASDGRGCRDTLTVDVTCREPRREFISAVLGTQGTFCLRSTETQSVLAYTLISEEPLDVVDFGGVDETGCVQFTAEAVGEVALLIEYCDAAGEGCDRTELNIEVFRAEDVKPPSANPDLFAVGYNGQRMMHVLTNDEVVGGATSLTVDAAALKGKVRVDAQNRLHYTAPADWCGNDRIPYTVCNAGGCDTASVKVQVTCEDLIVFNGFSPNNDGVNDHFEVLGIENYPDNNLVVFNQHGHQVYERSGYNNEWTGTYKGTPLTDGTYFYVLTVKGRDTKSGYLQIRR